MSIEDYMALPYTKLIQEIHDESGHYYYGRVFELDGCQSTGESIEELTDSLNEAMEEYLEVCLEKRRSIPLPLTDDGYSGKIVLRLPKASHRRLSIEVSDQGVSLNQWACY